MGVVGWMEERGGSREEQLERRGRGRIVNAAQVGKGLEFLGIHYIVKCMY